MDPLAKKQEQRKLAADKALESETLRFRGALTLAHIYRCLTERAHTLRCDGQTVQLLVSLEGRLNFCSITLDYHTVRATWPEGTEQITLVAAHVSTKIEPFSLPDNGHTPDAAQVIADRMYSLL